MSNYDTTCNTPFISYPKLLCTSQVNMCTGYIYDSYIWTTLEADLAIICASMPSLAPILAKIIPNFSRSTSRDQGISHCSTVKGSTSMPFTGSLTSAFPLAHISTTASSTPIVGSTTTNPWYQWYATSGGGGVGGTALNESEENIISNTDILADITTSRETGGITKTTVIEQSVSVESRTPSPKVADPPKKT